MSRNQDLELSDVGVVTAFVSCRGCGFHNSNDNFTFDFFSKKVFPFNFFIFHLIRQFLNPSSEKFSQFLIFHFNFEIYTLISKFPDQFHAVDNFYSRNSQNFESFFERSWTKRKLTCICLSSRFQWHGRVITTFSNVHRCLMPFVDLCSRNAFGSTDTASLFVQGTWGSRLHIPFFILLKNQRTLFVKTLNIAAE